MFCLSKHQSDACCRLRSSMENRLETDWSLFPMKKWSRWFLSKGVNKPKTTIVSGMPESTLDGTCGVVSSRSDFDLQGRGILFETGRLFFRIWFMRIVRRRRMFFFSRDTRTRHFQWAYFHCKLSHWHCGLFPSLIRFINRCGLLEIDLFASHHGAWTTRHCGTTCRHLHCWNMGNYSDGQNDSSVS